MSTRRDDDATTLRDVLARHRPRIALTVVLLLLTLLAGTAPSSAGSRFRSTTRRETVAMMAGAKSARARRRVSASVPISTAT